MIILGIESSCDETAAAVVADGQRVLSSVVASQVEVHHRYGGVVPELASRKHIEAILPVTQEALSQAGIAREALDAVAVTQGPGLVGSLLVGYSFAKALAYGLDIPWVGVNHLEGHILSVFLEDDPPDFPFCALLASGGHTAIYYVTASRRSNAWDRRGTMRPVRPTTKWPRCSAWGIPAARSSTIWRTRGIPHEFRSSGRSWIARALISVSAVSSPP